MDSPLVRVLLVEDDEDDCLLTRELLAEGFGGRACVEWAQTYADGLQKLTGGGFDVALVDHNLGRETGIELLRAACAQGSRVPVIMLTGQADRDTDLNAMHAGAADYLVKGRVTADALERAIRYARERHRLLERISLLSLTDELTGLHNRRAFFTLAHPRLQLLERRGSPCLLFFADVDNLKETNDTLGHEAGDRLLVDAANVLRSAFRRTDLVARLGGDEFVVLAADAEEGDIAVILAKLQQRIEERNAAAETAPPLSISVGTLAFNAGPSVRLQDLLAEADARMLSSKGARRRTTEPVLRAIGE
jgi:two-component system, cell cycle response regulator